MDLSPAEWRHPHCGPAGHDDHPSQQPERGALRTADVSAELAAPLRHLRQSLLTLSKMKKLIVLLFFVVWAFDAHAANIWSQPRFNGMGGTRVFISGVINYGDEKTFDVVTAKARPPVYIFPSGPGGNVYAALVIGNLIAERGFSTVVENGYKCASSCALIWASGYANHAIVRNSGLIYFHSCANYEAGDSYGKDDMECNYIIMKHLVSWGFTDLQARWAVLAPHEGSLLATKPLAMKLGFQWQWVSGWLPGWGDYCQARLCIVVP